MAAKKKAKTGSKGASTGKTKPTGLDFAMEYLRKDKTAAFADVAKAGAAKGIKVWGANYGRAQGLLGIVKAKPRGQGKAASRKKAKALAATGIGVRRGPGRPRKAPAADMSSLEGIVQAVRESEREKVRYRTALEKIHAILSQVVD